MTTARATARKFGADSTSAGNNVLWGDLLSTSSIVDSLGLASLSSGWLDLLPTQSYMNALIPAMKPILNVQLDASSILGSINTGLSGSWIGSPSSPGMSSSHVSRSSGSRSMSRQFDGRCESARTNRR